MFWRKKHSKNKGSTSPYSDAEYENWRALLFDTPIYEPKHSDIELPSPGDGLGWVTQMEEVKWGFTYFADFHKFVHQFHAPDEPYDCGPWRLERIADPYIRLPYGCDDPTLGLRYRVFYNSACTGDIEIRPWFREPNFDDLPDDFDRANLHIEIENAPFIPFAHLRGLLDICSDVFCAHRDWEGYMDKDRSISEALQRVLWESNRRDNLWETLEYSYHGTVLKSRPPGRPT